MASYYDLLGVPIQASEAEIRKAYRKKAKELHPDVNASEDAHQKFLTLHRAYKILTDKDKRFFYDQQLRGYSDPQKQAFGYYSQYQNFVRQNEWARMQKEKAIYEARLKQETFIKNREKFKASTWYYPAYGFIYVATFFCYLLGAGVLCICAAIVYHTHFMFVFLLSPFISGGIYFVKCTYDWFHESRKYFK